MKPRLGQIVFCIDKDALCVYKEEVLAIGKDFFIPDDFQMKVNEWQTIKFRKTYATLDEALKALQTHYEKLRKEKKIAECSLINHNDDWWEYAEIDVWRTTRHVNKKI